ncbi:hypothetical protein DERP_007358 [Dermatophagoides pteronyssinus]|uniref:Uncharacterized protein n=1 Tax=Dermatophagoides pteronyssinus TaxID=6956 RepID=A0ABQ8J4S2_DERPT|nr:hypothetical protein DERP_007358 [Dermatophagoides pteronyssinus]
MYFTITHPDCIKYIDASIYCNICCCGIFIESALRFNVLAIDCASCSVEHNVICGDVRIDTGNDDDKVDDDIGDGTCCCCWPYCCLDEFRPCEFSNGLLFDDDNGGADVVVVVSDILLILLANFNCEPAIDLPFKFDNFSLSKQFLDDCDDGGGIGDADRILAAAVDNKLSAKREDLFGVLFFIELLLFSLYKSSKPVIGFDGNIKPLFGIISANISCTRRRLNSFRDIPTKFGFIQSELFIEFVRNGKNLPKSPNNERKAR